MTSSRVMPVLSGVLMLSLSVVAVVLPLSAQEAAKKGPAKGRLPAYYADVVDDTEKQKIYDIQAVYEPKIDKLEAEIEALKSERDTKIEKLLPAAKLKKIEEARAAANAKREEKEKAKGDKKPEPKAEPKK